MDEKRPDKAVAEMLRTLNKGQYLMLCEAIRQLGGELYLNVQEFMDSAREDPPQMAVAYDGEDVLLRIK